MRVNRASDDSQWWLAGDRVRNVTGRGMSVRLAVAAMTGFQRSGSKCQLGGWQGKVTGNQESPQREWKQPGTRGQGRATWTIIPGVGKRIYLGSMRSSGRGEVRESLTPFPEDFWLSYGHLLLEREPSLQDSVSSVWWVNFLGWPECSFGVPTCYRKTWVSFLANWVYSLQDILLPLYVVWPNQ